MDSRREFLKKMILLSGTGSLTYAIPPAIQRALDIDPEDGSTYLDADHIVILMQENRSFDHCFGTLRGVRGYNDPRVIKLPNKNLVWLQSGENGDTYAPFHFDIETTKITWMGSIPHSRSSQVDAFNNGRYDKWIDSKKSGNKKFAEIPLTMGFFNRRDIPFHYAMADAFTICDQHFSAAMTSTWPNRLYLWGGTIREQNNINAKAYVRNNIPWGEAAWKTFPELLEQNGVSWKVYQNELSNGGGFEGEERSWLDNFGCNPMEHQAQFNSRFSSRYVNTLKKRAEDMPAEITALEKELDAIQPEDKNYEKKKIEIGKKKEVLADTLDQLQQWSKENFEKLSQYQKNLFTKAFTTNVGDPDYLSLTTLTFDADNEKREVKIPKGDVLFQFRKDVDEGKLPTVSWIVPSQKLSDHPSVPWYGTWYTSEILNILTKNPEVWKKTIFILTYDENDGYFDHVPPFVPPVANNPLTGMCSPSIKNLGGEYIKLENELAQGLNKKEARGGPIGLGFRVPLIIASPWSRGGKVNSQVLDHTSVLQFLEVFLNKKFQKNIRQETISDWRRTVCGNLTASFNSFNSKEEKLPFLAKDPLIEKIFNAQFEKIPESYKSLSADEIKKINEDTYSSEWMPRQEPGIKTACPLPYQLYVDGLLSDDKNSIKVKMKAAKDVFGDESAGSPFTAYAGGIYKTSLTDPQNKPLPEDGRVWHFAVAAGEEIEYEWPVSNFENETYDLKIFGPNGFYRGFAGNKNDPTLKIELGYEQKKFPGAGLSGNLQLNLSNTGKSSPLTITIKDESYKNRPVTKTIAPGATEKVILDLKKSYGWYDISIEVSGTKSYVRGYAGRVETGKSSFTDPAMGRVSS